jgi:hypothetical protein
MSSAKPNGVRDSDASRTTCTSCGAEGPVVTAPGVDWEGMCAVCAAKMQSYDYGWRGGALLAVGRAVENALAAPDCTAFQVRQAVEVALAGNTHPDWMLVIAEGGQVPDSAMGSRKPSRALNDWDNTAEMVRGMIEAGDIRHAAGYAAEMARDLARLVPEGSQS